MSIKPLSYHGFSLDFLVAGSNREKEGKRPGDITACVSVCDSVRQCQCTRDRVSVCMRVDMCMECVHVNLWPECHVT